MRSNFEKIKQNNCILYIHKNFRNDTLEQALLANKEELQRHYQLTAIRSSKFARVYKFTAQFETIDRAVYFKEYLDRSILDFIKHVFRASRARRAFNASLMLDENDFGIPGIVAMGECKSGFLITRNFLVTLEVEDAKQIYKFMQQQQANPSVEQLQAKRNLLKAFGQTVGRMHRMEIFHGDLRLGNVLAREGENGWEFFFLDNERTNKFHKLPDRLRLKNLVQINMHRDGVSNTDRLEFFKAYLEQNPDIRNARNKWTKKVIRKTDYRLRKKQLS